MDILQLIDRLEELFNAAKAVPFTHNVVVDEDRMLELIDQMRIAIPEEVKKAQQLLGQREEVAQVSELHGDMNPVWTKPKTELDANRCAADTGSNPAPDSRRQA